MKGLMFHKINNTLFDLCLVALAYYANICCIKVGFFPLQCLDAISAMLRILCELGFQVQEAHAGSALFQLSSVQEFL